MFKELLCALYVVSYSLNILYIVVMSWTEDKIKKLKELWGKGSTANQIAEIIGNVSRNAVIGKAYRLNLSAKTNDNGIVSNILLGVDYIPTWNWLSSIDVYDLNFNLDIYVSFFPQKYLRITNDNYRYKYNRTEIYQFNIGYSF